MLTVIALFFAILAALAVVLYLIFNFSRNWKKSARTVMYRYKQTREQNPHFSEKELFYAVLDGRYPEENPATKFLYQEKEDLKDRLQDEMKNKTSVIKNYDLATLIYSCLVIERNSILAKSGGAEKLLEKIQAEIEKNNP